MSKAIDDKEALEAIDKIRQKAMQKIEEKVSIAVQTYDLVDLHIQHLDADLTRFQEELRAANEFEDEQEAQRQKATTGSGSTGSSGAGASFNATGNSGYNGGVVSSSGGLKRKFKQQQPALHSLPSAAGAGSSHKARKRGSGVGAGEGLFDDLQFISDAAGVGGDSGAYEFSGGGNGGSGAGAASGGVGPVADDVPIDPNEPIYCFCQRVSFGQMVGCEGDDCRYEWFHFECVGLTEEPKGSWYCPECQSALGVHGGK